MKEVTPEDFGAQLKEIRERHGYSLRQVARQSRIDGKPEISPSYWSLIERGKRNIPKLGTLKRIAKGLRVPENDILNIAGITDLNNTSVTYTIDPKSIDDTPINTYTTGPKTAPIYGTIKAGPGGFAYEDHEGDMIVGGSHALSDHNFIWLRVSGDSMIGDGIQSGDLALIDTDAETECAGEILAVLYDGVLATLKHVTKSVGSIVLSASNSKYQPIILSGSDLETFRIVGKAVSIQRDI